MHFLVHNSNLVTVAVMGMVHAALLFIMWAAGVMPLVQFNLLSVIIYIFCMALCRSGFVMPVFISIIAEVTAYTVISTHYVGLRCGTYCFLFSIVPIIIYFGCFLFKGKKRLIIIALLAMNFAVFAFLYVFFTPMPPVYDVPASLRTTLVLLSAFAMVFATIFYNFMYIYASEGEVNTLERENRKLSVDAKEDALTNLLNRRGFLPLIEPIMKDEEKGHFCIAFCDIDNFKRINDSYGHDGGDEVLRHITALIRREMHGCDICRWGGEEIIILMKDYDLDKAREKAELLRRNIESNPTVFFNKRIFSTITIGLAENKADHREAEELIKVADERMYYGKQHGKNIVVWETLQA
ncbi:MAG: GGDEF domain-containing protein [Lachnospiraceae bacterium]|nr:GGDEF domain-containing protein [Lachnospiraceae bacterium]